ncbi:MAG: NGG1p interacting factor NIF3 [Candidatus Omnitrophica bacterium]|nr:NGG1p interacting factor NIF3 [Candidatus Omnitrophota bacterium]
MKLRTVYELAVKKGMMDDLRSRDVIVKTLSDSRKDYKKAKGIDKKTFDKARLTNPYADTRILAGSGEEEVKNVLVGIDVEVAEILMADRLREQGVKIDLIIGHHPEGKALTQLHEVMKIQSSLWEKLGLSKKVAEGIMKERIEEVARNLAPVNCTRAEDAAKILGIPFMCIHTAADNCVTNYLQKLFDKKKPKDLKGVLNLLKAIPEYQEGMRHNVGPSILIGDEKSAAGKIFVDMTGGTSGPSNLYPRLSQVGVGTVVGMHCKESSYKIAKTEYINYVIAGHMASDTLGLNLVFDFIEKKEKLNFIECSGFKRTRRK